MTTPGSNILNRATRLIAQQSVDYYQDIGRVNNEIGLDVTNYAPPVSILGSVQAVPLNDYVELGLDFGKTYLNLYTNTTLIGVERDVSGDVFVFSGRVYQCRSITNWKSMDGWNQVTAVETNIGLPELVVFIVNPDEDYIVAP